MDLEKLVVKVMAETSDAQKKLKKIRDEVADTGKTVDKSLSAAGNKSSSGLGKVLKQINAIRNAVNAFGTKARFDAGLIKPTKGYTELAERIIDADTELNKFKADMAALDKADPEYDVKFAAYSDAIAQAEDVIEGMNEALNEAVARGEAFEELQPPSFMRNMKAYIGEGLAELRRGIPVPEGLKKIGEYMRIAGAQGKVAGGNVKKFLAGIINDGKAAIGWLGKLKSGFGAVLSRIPLLGKSATRATSNFGGFIGKLIGLGTAVAVARKAISMAKEGMGNLSAYCSVTRGSLESLKSSLFTLKNALATAFAPVLNAVAPILATLIDWCTAAATAIAHLMAALTGKSTVVVARKATSGVASGIGDIGSAADDAQGSVDELKRSLMGFDEINKLDDDGNSGSGGGSGGGGGGGIGGAGGMFDTVEVGAGMASLAEKIKEAWENADFTDLGRMVGEKLKNALDSIPWSDIQEIGAKVGKSVATGLNGFLETPGLWASVGTTLAEALNTAIATGNAFVTNFHFESLGQAVADAVNSFVSKANWAGLGDTIGKAIAGALTTIETFFSGTNWENVGASLVEVLANINWVDIVCKAIKAAGSIADAIFGVIQGAVSTAKEKLKTWITSGKIWDDLFTVGGAVIDVGVKLFKDGWETIGTFVGAAVEVLIALGKSGWSTIETFVGTAVTAGVKLIKSGWSKLSDWIGTGVSVGVKLVKKWKGNVKKWFTGNSKGKISVTINRIKGWATSIKKWLTGNDRGEVNVTVKTSYQNTSSTSSYGTSTGQRNRGGSGQAKGGVYKNGSWHPVTAAANGGSFDKGQMFVAREAGPELVGTIGGHTAVMNNDQIVASVSDGVYRAVAAAMSHTTQSGTTVVLEGDAAKFFRVIQDEARKYVTSTGRSPFPV